MKTISKKRNRVWIFNGVVVLGALLVLGVGCAPRTSQKAHVDWSWTSKEAVSYIKTTYPEDILTQQALAQYARSLENIVDRAHNQEEMRKIAGNHMRSIECLFYLFPDDGDIMRRQLRAQILNTQERADAYRAFNKGMSGTITLGTRTSELPKTCEFDITQDHKNTSLNNE